MRGVSVLDVTRRHESSAANTFRISDDPPVFVRGDGPWLFDERGHRWLDLVCGSGTSNLGHNHPAHRAAVEEVAATGIFHTGTRLPSPFRAQLYEDLALVLPDGLDCIQLANSGAEAIEAAIKAAQFATGRRHLVAFEGGYHGRTLGALSVTSGMSIREPFSLLSEQVSILPFPHDGCDSGPEQCLEELSSELDRLRASSQPAAAIVIEAIQGVSGVAIPAAGFLQGVRDLATSHGACMICDEVWCGFGRTGRWFAFEREDVIPDMVVAGKGLSGGLPLSAVAGRAGVLQEWPAGMHTSTFQGNPAACGMASATVGTIRKQGLLEHVTHTVEPSLKQLQDALADFTTRERDALRGSPGRGRHCEFGRTPGRRSSSTDSGSCPFRPSACVSRRAARQLDHGRPSHQHRTR